MYTKNGVFIQLKKLYGNKLDTLDERELAQKEDLDLKEKEFALATEEQRRMLVRRFDLLCNKQKNLQLIEQQLKKQVSA
uniref:Uncharacterized protein n=1 Tax=Romanomermis culicivorax TaxID=13658 RepID=A0A915KWQ1_ROMCU